MPGRRWMCTSSAPQGLHIFHYFTVCCDLSGMAARRERERLADTDQQHTGTGSENRLNITKIMFKYYVTLIYYRKGRLYQLLKYVVRN